MLLRFNAAALSTGRLLSVAALLFVTDSPYAVVVGDVVAGRLTCPLDVSGGGGSTKSVRSFLSAFLGVFFDPRKLFIVPTSRLKERKCRFL